MGKIKWKRLKPEYCLFFLALIPFIRALYCDFLSFDDGIHIYENPLFMNMNLGKLLNLFLQPLNGLYIPLTYLYWGVLTLLSQKLIGVEFSPQLFHAGNLVLHAVNTLLVFQLIRFFAKSKIISLIAALFFAWHPLHTEPVLWISGAKDLLSSLFLLTALNTYLGIYGRAKASLVGFLFLCALLSKPSSSIFPFLLLVIEVGFFGQKVKASLIKFSPLFILSVLVILVNKQAQPSGILTFQGSFIERVFVSADSFGFYLSKIFIPFGLSLNYGRTPEWILRNLVLSRFILLGGLLLFWVLFKRKMNTALSIGALFVFLVLPTSGWVPFYYQRFSNVADRFAYPSLLAFSLGVAIIFARRQNSKWTYASLIACLCACAYGSYNQTRYWRGDHTLLERMVEINPTAENHYNLANALTELKEARHVTPPNSWRPRLSFNQKEKDILLKRIEMHFMQSINLDPTYTRAYNNLGISRAVAGDVLTAEYFYQKAIDTNPELVQAYNNLGVSQASRMLYKKAMSNFQKALELSPDFSDAHFNLGLVLEALGRGEEALTHLDRANQLSPNRLQFKSKWKLADKR